VKAAKGIVDLLNDVLTAELTAINQYFVDAKMCENWGYAHLAEHIRDDSIDEMKDAEKLVDRILYLDGVPNMQRLGPVKVGETVIEKLRLALALETELLEGILRGEEEHADWLESQLDLINQIGEAHYLAQQVRS
jgi:bacterioferritin